jgi:hypothetical protein
LLYHAVGKTLFRFEGVFHLVAPTEAVLTEVEVK